MASRLTDKDEVEPYVLKESKRTHACDGPDRLDRDEDTPIVGQSSKLDLQMGDSSANAIRASGLHRPAQQAGYKTAALPPTSSLEEIHL